MKRREFITLLGGAAAAWPLAARTQQPGGMRRIGVLVGSLPAGDPEWQARGNAFVQGLQERGWSDGRNLRIEYRWGLGNSDRLRKYATELVALAPDVILAAGPPAVAALQQSSRSVPIVSRMFWTQWAPAMSPPWRGRAAMPPASQVSNSA
jgi:putative ABC transport system substrate-binding protein